jgi:hypothetical protein
MISPQQIRTGRQLLGWSKGQLARIAEVPFAAAVRAEARHQDAAVPVEHVRAMMVALESAGIIFMAENGEGPGVRLRKG